MRLFFLGFLLAYLGGNLWLFMRSLALLAGTSTGVRWLYGLLFWLAALSMILSMLLRHTALPSMVLRTLFMVGSCWMVFTLYMVLSLLLFDLAQRCGLPLSRPFLPALALTFALLLYGYWNYRHPRIERLVIQTDRPLDKPCRIVAVSDVHLGEGTRKRALQRYVALIEAQNPDLILIGGDLIDNAIEPVRRQRMEEELSQLRAPFGVWMVPGNHEYISGIEACRAFLSQTPIRLLRDEVITLPNGLQLIGRDDRSNRQRRPLDSLLAKTTTDRPRLLLDHQPYELERGDSLGIDLQFYGHTHRGQVWPISLLTDHIYTQSHGYRKWETSHIVVSSGLSLWGPPFRIGTHSDLWVIDLVGSEPKR